MPFSDDVNTELVKLFVVGFLDVLAGAAGTPVEDDPPSLNDWAHSFTPPPVAPPPNIPPYASWHSKSSTKRNRE